MTVTDPLGLRAMNDKWAAQLNNEAWEKLAQTYAPAAVPQQCTTAKCGCGRVLVAGECPNCGYHR